jgi:hypothetical protein
MNTPRESHPFPRSDGPPRRRPRFDRLARLVYVAFALAAGTCLYVLAWRVTGWPGVAGLAVLGAGGAAVRPLAARRRGRGGPR